MLSPVKVNVFAGQVIQGTRQRPRESRIDLRSPGPQQTTVDEFDSQVPSGDKIFGHVKFLKGAYDNHSVWLDRDDWTVFS